MRLEDEFEQGNEHEGCGEHLGRWRACKAAQPCRACPGHKMPVSRIIIGRSPLEVIDEVGCNVDHTLDVLTECEIERQANETLRK